MPSVAMWMLSAAVSDDELTAFERVLDDEEQSRVASARTDDDRRRYIVAHGAARVVLGAALGLEPHRLTWVRGRHGKPSLAGVDSHVNMSHSGEWSMVALSFDRPVGVDIQNVMPTLDAVAMARRFFTREEADLVDAAGGGAAEVFARLWVRKEAVIKAAGGRLMRGLGIAVAGDVPVEYPDEPGQGIYRVTDVAVDHGYRAAVALAGADDFDVTVRTGPR